jgi:O-antigen/teichoic acid export membrane protein
LKSLLTKFGVDRSVFLTVSNRILLAFGSVFNIYLISKFLTKAEQGYYYTFGSIAALQVFFELGLSVVITQFVAHEFAFLTINEKAALLEGEVKHVGRLSSLLHFIVKWYMAGAFILLLVIIPAGFIFFNNFKNNAEQPVSWQWPWVVMVVFTALNLLISAYIPYLEGLNKIKQVAEFRIIQGIAAFLALCISLTLRMGLCSLGIVAGVNFLLLLIWMLTNKYKPLIIYLWKQFSSETVISWKKEIFPFQWKIALSWLSGYFIFQIFNPIIFAFEGAVKAGQLGITLTAFNGISVIAMAWINTKVPTFSIFIARRDYKSLDDLFFLTLKQSFTIIILLVISFLGGLYVLQTYFPQFLLGQRFLPVSAAVFLGIITITNQVIFSLASYLRSHKQEPLLLSSLVGAVLTLFFSYFFAKWFGVFGMVASNCMLTLFVGLGWVIYIFIQKRKEWHRIEYQAV